MSHVTLEQRYTIAAMLKQGFNQIEIGNAIDKDKSVVSREIARNCDLRSKEYKADLAQKKYESRLKEKPKRIKFIDKIENYVALKIKDKWSPEQISKTPNNLGFEMVSTERIYQFVIDDKKKGGDLHKELRRKKKYKKRFAASDTRGKLKDCKSIKTRPTIVDKKTRVGDLEVDLIIGANHKGAILTINDRKTGYAWIRLLKSKDSNEVSNELIKALYPYRDYIHTITSDNGKEFGNHKMISDKLKIEFYFAEPYSSWQRGANENLNGLIRQYFPKKTNFEQLNWREIKFVESKLNKRPRKRLGYKSPENEFIFLTRKVAFVT